MAKTKASKASEPVVSNLVVEETPTNVAAPPRPSDTTRSYRDCFLAFVSEARTLSDAEIRQYRGDARLARFNVCGGVDSVLPHAARLATEFPAVPVARLGQLPDLARAIVYATKRTERRTVSDGELQEKSSLIAVPRQEMLAAARGFARRGIFDDGEVRAIERGNDRVDSAEDVIALIALFTDPLKQAELQGMHFFTAKEFRLWREAAEFLVENLTPTGARKADGGISAPERELYALWTILLRDHAWLRKAGFFLFDEGVFEARVPKVLSRTKDGFTPADPGESTPADDKTDPKG